MNPSVIRKLIKLFVTRPLLLKCLSMLEAMNTVTEPTIYCVSTMMQDNLLYMVTGQLFKYPCATVLILQWTFGVPVL